MKNKKMHLVKSFRSILAGLLLTLFATGCGDSDSASNYPSAGEFNNLKDIALNSITQTFDLNVASGLTNFTTANGVTISIDGSDLTLNGNPVTGQVDIEYVEIFKGGDMLTTGMHTMGKLPGGDRAMLVSGGEFYINATKNGQQLELNGHITLQIPTQLTDDNGGNNEMTLWEFVDGNFWLEQQVGPNGVPGAFLEGQGGVGINSIYYAFVDDFGWCNVDVFYSDPRPKTTILASVPDGYDNQNCAIYLHYDGEGNGLANLDTYDTATGLFSEHYGQIPIGLECHIIFVTEDNGQWRYAIKPATISANAVYDFTLAETSVGTQAQLTAAINALP
ncbi:hypothetical protein [Flavobacterium terrisoli]|uniref:hypothetical protein n=1 Tax=Flavobacterium terrisoli TaxID=3242195 RepID=UPI002542976E|nr:hypothetical protein [Flavobacterium buctense]